MPSTHININVFVKRHRQSYRGDHCRSIIVHINPFLAKHDASVLMYTHALLSNK